MRSARGVLTKEVKKLSKVLMGYEINKVELRLMPYLQYVVMNSAEMANINKEEYDVLRDWRDKGWVSGTLSDFKISEDFWGIINKILWLSYVNKMND